MMGNAKFTKGRWEVVERSRFETKVMCGNIRIAEVKHYNTGVDDWTVNDPTELEGKANAQLISKAPEMFDFINRISGEMLRNDFVLEERWYEQARELIKEATKIL